MSKRRRTRKRKEEPSPYKSFSDKRDMFYGATFGAAVSGLVSMALIGEWGAFAVFLVGYVFWFAVLFGLDIPTKPIRLSSRAFKLGLGIGPASFALFVGTLYLLLG